jgi:hypothetical protein
LKKEKTQRPEDEEYGYEEYEEEMEEEMDEELEEEDSPSPTKKQPTQKKESPVKKQETKKDLKKGTVDDKVAGKDKVRQAKTVDDKAKQGVAVK